jgi:hypothetical protein
MVPSFANSAYINARTARTIVGFLRSKPLRRGCPRMSTDLEPESDWLRFLLRRLNLGLRDAKSPATINVLKELISLAEDRLDRVEASSPLSG